MFHVKHLITSSSRTILQAGTDKPDLAGHAEISQSPAVSARNGDSTREARYAVCREMTSGIAGLGAKEFRYRMDRFIARSAKPGVTL